MVSTSNRWLTTIWNASPARISSTAAGLPLWNSSGVRCRRTGAGSSNGAETTEDGVGSASRRSHRLDPGDRVGVRLVDPLVAPVEVDRVGDQPHLAVVMVQHRQVGGQQEGELRNLQIVGVAVGQTFDPAHRVVARGSRPYPR